MRKLLIALVRGYRLLLSPWLGSACRFEPTCSLYAAKLPPETVRSDAAKTAPPWAALLVLKTNLSVSVAVPPT